MPSIVHLIEREFPLFSFVYLVKSVSVCVCGHQWNAEFVSFKRHQINTVRDAKAYQTRRITKISTQILYLCVCAYVHVAHTQTDSYISAEGQEVDSHL